MLYTHNLVRNGDLGFWDTNTPRHMDAQTTNTTLLRLQTNFDEFDGRRRAWDEIAGRNGDKFVYSGHSSLRATLAAAASANDFRLHPEDVNATAFTGASTEHIKLFHMGIDTTAGEATGSAPGPARFRFVFAARSDQSDTVLNLRVIGRNNADGVELYLQDGDRELLQEWAAADTTRPNWEIGPRWRQYGVTFEVPLGNGNDVIEHFVWQLSNGTAGAQIIDIDEIRCERFGEGLGAP